MAGWICQTKKIISTVMASLADDLEQTVQELNDVIYRLGATHADSSSINPLTLPDGISDTDSPHLEEEPSEKQLQLDPTAEEAKPHNQLKEEFKSTLTRQPETVGFPLTLNSRLSQSSPTLQISENGTSGLEDSRLSSMSSFQFLISSSSPCLMQTPGKTAEQPSRASLVISGRHLRHPHLYSKSSQSLEMTMKSGSQNVCPCHRRDSFKITQGMKHPGRVIRTQSSVTLEQSQPPVRVDPGQSPVMEEHSCSFEQRSCTEKVGGQPEDDFDSPRSILDLKDRESGSRPLDREHGNLLKREYGNYQLEREHGNHKLDMEPSNHLLDREPSNHQLQTETDRHHAGETSMTPALVEHDTHFLRWASLRSFTRILSFAFAQLANVVLLFSDNSQSVHNLTSGNSTPETESKPHEVTSAVYPVSTGDHGQIENTYKRHVNEQEVQRLNVPQRTHSTDSFEIIESSCFNGAAEEDPLHQRLIPEYQTNQTHPQSSSEALDDRLAFSSSHFSSDHSIPGSGSLTSTSTSSTDWVCFDFRKLLTDGQFGVDKPMSPGFPRGSTDVNSCNVDSDYELVAENILYQSVNDDSNNGCHHGSDRGGDSDDDKDSNASFIILSDNDINNEFLF